MKRKPPSFEFDMPRQREISVAEHEVLVSFADDVSAEIFTDWLNIQGKALFEAWALENLEEYQY